MLYRYLLFYIRHHIYVFSCCVSGYGPIHLGRHLKHLLRTWPSIVIPPYALTKDFKVFYLPITAWRVYRTPKIINSLYSSAVLII